ncbi:MAG TPA: hypothetical protein VJ724_03075, partial [Tahibacter sp.]|nr:hypothetical protein [Tahibacter sp.]
GGWNIDVASAVAVQPDGRIVVAGGVRTGASSSDIAVVRLTPDGTLDASFDADGIRYVNFGLSAPGGESYDSADALALQSDGKIVVAGSATSANGWDTVVTRLTPAGALDATFGNYLTGRSRFSYVAGRASHATAVAVSEPVLDPNGGRRIVVASDTTTATAQVFALAVLRDDGTLDPGFSADGKTTIAFDAAGEAGATSKAVAIRSGFRRVGSFLVPYRQIVAGGHVSLASGRTAVALARVNFDGSLDATFGNGGKSRFTSNQYLLGPPTSCNGVALARQGAQLVVGARCRVLSGNFYGPDSFALMRAILDE